MAQEIKLDAIAALTPYEVVRVDSGVVTIGREPENSIVVDSDLVSRRHSGVYEVGSQWIYRDLGSTNGSWVNGIEIKPGHAFLLRNEDVVRVADFPLQVNYTSEIEINFQSIIILLSDKFDQELPLEEGLNFIFGGPDASVVIDGSEDEEIGRIVFSNSSLTLNCNPIENPRKSIMVNGVVAQGTLSLSDRDFVTIGHYTLIINLSGGESKGEGRRYAERVRKETSEEIANIGAYDSTNLPEHLKGKKKDDGWESHSARRRSNSGKMFVFGTEPESGQAFSETQSLSAQDIKSKLGYEMSPSQRFKGSFGSPVVDEKKSKTTLKMLRGVGAFFFLCIVAAVIYFVFFSK